MIHGYVLNQRLRTVETNRPNTSELQLQQAYTLSVIDRSTVDSTSLTVLYQRGGRGTCRIDEFRTFIRDIKLDE